MKKTTASIVSLFACVLTAVAGLRPDAITNITWSLTDASAYADTNQVYLTGITYNVTNAVAYTLPPSGPSTNRVYYWQDLTGLKATLRVGDNGTNLLYTAIVPAGTQGLFSCMIQFPRWTPGPSRSNTGQEGIELTLTDTNANVTVTYKARKLFTVMQPMH